MSLKNLPKNRSERRAVADIEPAFETGELAQAVIDILLPDVNAIAKGAAKLNVTLRQMQGDEDKRRGVATVVIAGVKYQVQFIVTDFNNDQRQINILNIKQTTI